MTSAKYCKADALQVIVNDNILLDTKLRVNQAKDAEQLGLL